MTEIQKFDVCVIGAGPGGYIAAIYAGRAGKKTAIIEKEFYGGTCLNVGCIPTKTLLASADVYRTIKHSTDFGVKIEGSINFDWNAVLNRKNSIIEKLRSGIAGLLKNAGVTVFSGVGEFISNKKIKITNSGITQEIEADKVIIATGSKPAMPSFIPKSDRILNSTELLSIPSIPKSLIILGGGVIGCEFASLFAELGTEVTIVEMMPEILPEQDSEIAKQLGREFKKRKMKILTGKPLENIRVENDKVYGFVNGQEISADYMLVSIGRLPFTEGLNPQAAGVNVNQKGFISVDYKCKTNVENIFAIGDVTGRIQLAHLASAMGLCAAKNAAGEEFEFCDCLVPGCIFTHPEIGSIGLTQEKCEAMGIRYRIGKFPFSALGKAMAINETAGFCKIITSETDDKIIGVHIIGPHAADLISEAVAALNAGMTAEQLGHAIHAHPTLGEAIMETSHAVHNNCLHMPIIKKG